MKTIEEAAIEYTQTAVAEQILHDYGIDVFVRAFLSGVEFAQRWISVDEELPENAIETTTEGNYKYTTSPVLVKTRNGQYTIAKRKEFLNHGWRWSGSGTFNDSVTYWRPIELK
jgi:hypothetical protein